jgi:hypothetical protein
MARISRLIFVVMLAIPASLQADTRTWTGAVDNFWSTAANWDTGAPVAGDDLVFSNSVRTNNINDYPAGTAFGFIHASDGPWTFSGNEIVLTKGILAGTATFALPITLGASQTWQTTIVRTTSFTETVDLNGNTLTLFPHYMSGGDAGIVDISGTIEGSGPS